MTLWEINQKNPTDVCKKHSETYPFPHAETILAKLKHLQNYQKSIQKQRREKQTNPYYPPILPAREYIGSITAAIVPPTTPPRIIIERGWISDVTRFIATSNRCL